MTLKSLSLSSLLHGGFIISDTDLIESVLLENELRPYAERALMKEVLVTGRVPPLPELRQGATAEEWNRMRRRLDYPEANRTVDFLAGVDVTLEELSKAIDLQLRTGALVERYMCTVLDNPLRREAVIWEMFLDSSLRPWIIRVAGRRHLASLADSATATENERKRIRKHLVIRHDLADWGSLLKRLGTWGLTEECVDRLVGGWALALTTRR